ncbi:Uncharacterised protein [Mycobacteroides abscessus subsp. bolletii]|nr:Uncharacterised protein [Mycobacteroides abscessus subsp. bolletii]
MSMRNRRRESLFSFRGRVITAILCIGWAAIIAGALVYYGIPLFWSFVFPWGIGTWVLTDAVKRKQAGDFDESH